MIKVNFYTDDRDVCSIMEDRVTDGIDIEDWLIKQIEGISFDGMDYPCDMEFSYDCYFQSDADEVKAREIYCLLKSLSLERFDVSASVWITDRFMKEETRITGM